MNILDNREDAEESVSDTWLSAWNHIPPDRPNVLSVFLGRITRNLSIDRFRQRQAFRRGGGSFSMALEELGDCVSGEAGPEDAAIRRETLDAIERFLRELLPEGYQSVLIRRPSDVTLPVTKWENGAWTEQTEDFLIACAQTDEWSTYRPMPNNDEWVMLVRSMLDREASIFYTKEPGIKFAVRDMWERSLDQCVQWAERTYGEYNPSEGKDGSISGRQQGVILSIRFVQYRSGFFALVGTYPERETDGLGVYIKMMFDYFRVEMYPPTTLLGTWELYGDVTKKNGAPEVMGYTFYANMTGQAILSTGEARPFAYAISNDTLELRFFSGEIQRLPYRREEDKLVLTQDYQEVSYYWQTRGKLVYDWMVE